MARRIRWPRVTRDTALFLTGLVLTIREAFFEDAERPYLLMIFAGMMGLPVFLRRDEKTSELTKLIVPDKKRDD